MKILIFTEGTALVPSSYDEKGFDDFKAYVPCVGAPKKLHMWKNQGAELCYLTSRTTPEEVNIIKSVLQKYNFPDAQNLFYRTGNEAYKDVAEKVLPDVLIEDDCASIGGEIEMTYPHIKPELKQKIHSVVVKEFQGIIHLPDNIADIVK